jgi:hypothetical protein
MINDHLVGILGLDNIIKRTVETNRGKSDEDITNILLSKIAVNNYVPPSAQDAYGHALLRLRQHKDYLLLRNSTYGLDIAVLGMSCARCSQLEDDVLNLLSQMKITANLHHITNRNSTLWIVRRSSPSDK